MQREERVTVQGPVKEQQPDGMSHRGAWTAFSRHLLPGLCRAGATISDGPLPVEALFCPHSTGNVAAVVAVTVVEIQFYFYFSRLICTRAGYIEKVEEIMGNMDMKTMAKDQKCIVYNTMLNAYRKVGNAEKVCGG